MHENHGMLDQLFQLGALPLTPHPPLRAANKETTTMFAQLYAVWDRLAEDWMGSPFLQKHDNPAIRLFADGIADKTTALAAHPHDYDLYCLGSLTPDGIEAQKRLVTTGETIATVQRGDHHA